MPNTPETVCGHGYMRRDCNSCRKSAARQARWDDLNAARKAERRHRREEAALRCKRCGDTGRVAVGLVDEDDPFSASVFGDCPDCNRAVAS